MSVCRTAVPSFLPVGGLAKKNRMFLQFLEAIPKLVLYGCAALIMVAVGMTIALIWKQRRLALQVEGLTRTLNGFSAEGSALRNHGLPLAAIDKIGIQCEGLDEMPRGWWKTIDFNIEQYTSPEEVDGWFLTERARELLPHEVVIGRNFNAAFFSAFPGLLTGAGLTLTFIAILLALYGVHYNKANTAEPISGIDALINGLSGKFLSSIVALLLSIMFTLYEKHALRSLRTRYERLLAAISRAFPYLPPMRVLLDIQRFAAKQTVSVS